MWKAVLSHKNLKVIAAIFFALLLVNTAIFFSGPFWDDYEFIFSNAGIMEQANPFAFWVEGSGFERVWALGYTQFWVLVRLFEHNYWAYKLVSLFFHSLNAFMLYLLASKIRIEKAYFVAMIFMFHPFHVETLSWIFQLNTIMGLFWALVSTHFLVDAFQTQGGNKRIKRVLYLAFFAMAYFFSLKTKPVAILVPFCTVFLLDLNHLKKNRSALILISLVLFALGLYVAFKTNNAINNSVYENSIRRTYFFDEMFGRIAFGPNVTSLEGSVAYNTLLGKYLLKLHLISRNFLFYVSNFLIPHNFLFIYPKWELHSAVGALSVSLFLLISIAMGYSLFKVKERSQLVPIALVVAGFIPISGVIYIPYMKYSYVSDHWAYVMCGGLALVLVQFAALAEKKFKIKSLNGALFLFVFVIGIQQARYGRLFNSTREMLRHNIDENPKSVFLYQYLARLYLNEAQREDAYNLIEEGLKVAPSDEQLMKLKGEVYGTNEVQPEL